MICKGFKLVWVEMSILKSSTECVCPNMSFRTSVCLSEHFVPMLSTPLFVFRMEWQVYLWIPHVQAEVLRLIWCNYEQTKENFILHASYTANLCNQSVTEGQQIDAILANFLLLQLLFTIFADFWLQIKSASFKCKNYTYYLLHLKAALLKEN